MMSFKEIHALLEEGKFVPVALDVLINSLFEYGDILFDPDGPHGPSLIINNEFGTEISLTKKQAEILRNAGVPCLSDMEEDQDDI